ncbi:MAG: hypothetical protein ABJA82_14940 [Myxococcales bacterium]
MLAGRACFGLLTLGALVVMGNCSSSSPTMVVGRGSGGDEASTGGSSGAGAAGAGGELGDGSIGGGYPCNSHISPPATGGVTSGGAAGAADATGGGGGVSGSGGATETARDVTGPTCIVGQTYCTKTTLPPFGLNASYQGLCNGLPRGTPATCATMPTCRCLCSAGECCPGRHFTSCDDSDGVVTVYCGGI